MAATTPDYSGDPRAGHVYPDDPAKPVDPDASLGDLIGKVSQDFSQLVSTQVELAKVEIKEEIATASKGAGLLGGGALCAYMALVLLSFAVAWGLAEIMAEGLAFLIVGAVYAIAAAVLLPKGKNKLTAVNPVPERTAESVKEDVEWARNQMH